LNRRRIGFPVAIGSYIVGFGFLVEYVSWPPAVLLLWSVVGGCGGGRFGIGFVKAEASSSGHSPWRIRCEFVESGALVGAPDLGGSSTVLPSSPSVSASVMLDSPAGSSGGKFYQLVESGWSSSPTFSGGFFSLQGVSSSGDLGPSTVVASDCRFSGDAMDVSHLVRPARSTSKMCVGVAGVLLWVPLKICVSSSGGWSAATRWFRPSATSSTVRSL